jgi:RTX calcium-binding nonapeptide repeat (4 copies)
MLKKNLLLGIGVLVGVLVVTGTVILPGNLVWADVILCSQTSQIFCFGTNGDDTIVGDDEGNRIIGLGGNDVISAKGGDDLISGALGADKIVGGDGNDRIFHGEGDRTGTGPHGSRDVIDCGAGNDEVFINVNVDQDIAGGCEIVHAG